MNKKLTICIVICILQNVNTDNHMETTTEENNSENVTINDNNVSIDNNKTFYNDTTLNKNSTNDFEYYTDLNNNDTVPSYDEISEVNESTDTIQVKDNQKDDNYVTLCQYKEETYILNGQVVTATIPSARPPNLWVEQCRPSFKVDAILNMSMTVNVNEMYVRNVEWPSIPETVIATKVILTHVTPTGLWGGCSQLTDLSIEFPNFKRTPPDWLANCTKLRTMALGQMKLSELKFILDSAPRVEELELRDIYELDTIVYSPMFPSARAAHQWIRKIEIHNYGVESMDLIEDGNVTSEDMSASLLVQMSLLPELEELVIFDFKYFDFCASGNLTSVTLRSLRRLMLYSTDTRTMCLRELRKLPKLTNLELQQNHFNTIEFGELFSKSSPQLYVELELARVKQFTFSREDYLALTDGTQKGNVTLNLFQYYLQCDCGSSLWLARSILDGLVTASGMACQDGSALEDQNCDWLNCDRVPCNSTCVCCVDGPDTVVGDCRDANLKAFPEDLLNFTNLTAMMLPYNNVTQLPKRFPANLKFLDLSGNDVFRKSGEVEISALFAAPDRHVLMFGNAIICSCDTQNLITTLQDHKDQIEDYEHLMCAGDNTKLSTVEASTLCSFQNRQKSIILVVSLLLLAAVFSLVFGTGYYYRKSIQVYFFARGWCLSCIKEEELDAERLYDIFLSFCYEDDTFVIQNLLSVLDREYSVCVHYRDWRPGDMIPAQITKSVEQSRRTLVVVSRNFMKSLWGLLEFRTAHFSGLLDGRVRVVMVVIDDILDDENLESEVKAYVRLNTYVKWGDPWFWDKLRFALPHRPTPLQRNLNSERLANFVNEQLPMIEMPPDDDLNHSRRDEL